MKWVGDITYIHTWTGARLPDNRSRLLHEEGRGLLHGQSYAHQPGVRRDQHGRAQPPPTLQAAAIFHSDRGSQYTFRPRIAIHVAINSPSIYVSTVSSPPWAGPVCVGTMPGPSHSTPHSRTNEYTPMVYPTREHAIKACHVLDRTDIQSQTTSLKVSTTAPQTT